MLDLRPGNIPALTRAAYLRELFGDIDGALELMHAALGRMPYQEAEDRAWVLAQIGHLELLGRRPAEAERAIEQALDLFPSCHHALGALAEVRTAQKRYREAVDLQQQRHTAAPGGATSTGARPNAWALFKNGKRAEARNEIAAVLAVGVQHPRVLERAGLIQGRESREPRRRPVARRDA
jgi:tetratricopeptide (TPR) repeat protein